jgi:isocitrate dehydrogenase kinase/phosphatase
MTPELSDSRLANVAARTINDSWTVLSDRFRIITRRAKLRFDSRDWAGMAADHVERLDLYSKVAGETADAIRTVLDRRLEDRNVWMAMKAVYSGLIAARPDWELAETFFNSVTRKIFSTVGVDPRIEFVDTDYDSPPSDPPSPVFTTYEGGDDTAALLERILQASGFDAPFVDLRTDAELVASRVDGRVRRVGGLRSISRIDMVNAVFYRGKGAYLVGRVASGTQSIPLVIALLHEPEGVVVDAVMLTENQISILFSFTRSYFHVDVAGPNPLIHFLSTLMPRKRRAELYISIGHNKHGKTELYRELRRHIAYSGERFEVAPGVRGLVMIVFTLPGFDVVLKVIKDRFGEPKQLTRDHVLSRYRLVFRHDRAGRLVDAQEYEHLEFPRSRFEPELLEILTSECARSVMLGEDTVTIAHAYIERRVIPLDVFLDEAQPEAAEAAIVDYGSAIKDLAASGIFPGDMLLKNFGVTRHGRVVFYDYDELTTLDECVFRRLPVATTFDDELAAEPWFSVGPSDVFPEEFATFLGVQGRLREVFMIRHADLFRAEAWQEWQRQVSKSEIIEIFPYDDDLRLRPRLVV